MSRLKLIKTSKVAKELVIYLIARNTLIRIPPTQVETAPVEANATLTGNPTMVNDVPVVETPLITPTALAPVDACSNLL